MRILILFTLLMCNNTGNKQKNFMPEKMPADLEVVYSYNSGMLPKSGKYDLAGGLCRYEVREPEKSVDSGTIKIPLGRVEAAYLQLKKLQFDRIKVNRVFAHDAGNTSVFIYWNDRKNMISISKNDTDKMSAEDQQKWTAALKIIKDLFGIKD